MRALDAHAINTIGIPGMVLMENAARSVLEIIEKRYGDVDDLSIAVLCGPGNNGGDGFALARHLHLRGADVDVILLGREDSLRGDALANYRLLQPIGISPVFFVHDDRDGLSLVEYDLIVDAIFGTGTARKPEGVFAQAINAINEAECPAVAVDVPTGVDATTGRVLGEAVRADVTVTFQFPKSGLILPPGRDFVGDLIIAPISIPGLEDVLTEAGFALPDDDDVRELLPPRPRDAHKGDFGNLLVIAGSRGMSGAARLVGMAALRTGVGLVKIATPESIRSEVAVFRPELMTIGLPETPAGTISPLALEILKPHLEWADVVALGPGMGRDPQTGQFIAGLLSIDKPLVIDADGLNLIADHGLLPHLPAEAILTPHPGEFDRLAGNRGSDFYDRTVTARNFAQTHQIALLLKGAPTVCYDPAGLGMVNPTGNPGLATAGSGDVLTGIVAGLRTQGLGPYEAAWVGAYLHGRAADAAAEQLGEASLVAGDVINFLSEAFASLQADEAENEH